MLGYFDSLILDLSRSKESWLTFGPVIRKLFTDLENNIKHKNVSFPQLFSVFSMQNTEDKRSPRMHNIYSRVRNKQINKPKNSHTFIFHAYIYKTELHNYIINCCICTYFIIFKNKPGKYL